MYEELQFDSWSKTKTYIAKLNSNWIFRGQEVYDWSLSSAIDRVDFSNCPQKNAKQDFEFFSIRDIKRNPLLYSDKKIPDTDFQMISLLQHYGLPTRLLDFTNSPFVAIFFAIENSNSDCSVFAINYHQLMSSTYHLFRLKHNDGSPEIEKYKKEGDLSNDENFKNIVLNTKQRDFVQMVQPFYLFDRIIQQRGAFLCQGNINKSFEENLAANFEILQNLEGWLPYKKIKIKSEWRTEILRDLFQMNISRQTLFPGIEGAIMSLKNKFDISSADWKAPD